ncbi:MAG: N-glycosylase/DNA lyase [Candidatus Aenigmatarchaeota archaeon]|nr:MAG: N-glycosylase/DNA lyase [Candidatus Aenigmarchaeota archaeon]
MQKLIVKIGDLKKSELRQTVDVRLNEFKSLGKQIKEEVFKELCFCLLTANYSAEGGMRMQDEIGDGFITFPKEKLAIILKELGHRFPEARAGYIVEARKHIWTLDEVLLMPGESAREWLVKNVKGLGFKEASHFLRNVGFENLAIIDFHIVDILVKNGMIEKPKTLTPKRYMEIEKVLKKLGGEMGMSMAELDLYLWYCETGKVLK